MPRSEPARRRDLPDVRALTGIRSSKPTFYAEYRSSEARLVRALRALDHIAQELTATADSPAELCGLALVAAADHLASDEAFLVLHRWNHADAAPEVIFCDHDRRLVTTLDALPEPVRLKVARGDELMVGETCVREGYVCVPVAVDGEHGGTLLVRVGDLVLEEMDLALLRTLGNHMSVALRASHLLAHSELLRAESEALYAEAARQAGFLSERNQELEETQQRLMRAHQRETVDEERHRLARELHDSVAQHVLSAGMAIEWCRTELEPGSTVRVRLEQAKEQTRVAVECLRTAIFALGRDSDEDTDLAGMLNGLRAVHGAGPLDIKVRIEGRPVRLSSEAEQSLFRVASEALFNTLVHAHGTRATVRLSYGQHDLTLTVSDDGDGNPDTLRRVLRNQENVATGGDHRGLVNIAGRITELGGTLQFRRSRMGGVRLQTRVPLRATYPTALRVVG